MLQKQADGRLGRVHNQYGHNGALAWAHSILHNVRLVPRRAAGGYRDISEEIEIL
jgi:hypothetical protein